MEQVTIQPAVTEITYRDAMRRLFAMHVGATNVSS